ncbi:hypothetical protein [Limnoglobus roseus]|uniref:Uncharacterized protein n=1 Tax=Limnoglobus roseus TaxID=2598579 RepID=A0A5C1AQK9_9BACT|nr:hypothetical protein [Limnoglobus roseus]QEL20477.1 hypothetical protein PX52LOC_07578 [Limnoglobus roseus]
MRTRSPVRRLERRLSAYIDATQPPLSDPEWLAVFRDAVARGWERRVPGFAAAVAAYRAAAEAAARVAPEVDPPTGFALRHPRRVPVLFTGRLDPRFPAVWAAFARACELYLRAEGVR